MARRRRQATGQIMLFSAPELERPKEELEVVFVDEADDRPRCVLCGEPARPDSVYSSRLDGSACQKCHDEWLKTLY